jgi:hypothetical protein
MTTATTSFWSDLNGRIACEDHIGFEASSKLSTNKSRKSIKTSMTIWSKMTIKEVREFSELVGLDHTICESCRYSA